MTGTESTPSWVTVTTSMVTGAASMAGSVAAGSRSIVTGTVGSPPFWPAVATRPAERTEPSTRVPSGSSTVTAWPRLTRSWRPAAMSSVTTRFAVVASRTGAPGPTAVPTGALWAATRMAPGRNAMSPPSSVPSRLWPAARCQRFTARVVFASQWRLTFMPLGA